ncbi:nucleotide pyrophosphohydrolase [Tersicoccus solisilvae]|uniref:nucleotide pyrophosphohydrolase n=1 Tax=Tersicoccus solisilvae TaxID=1882339 RepID=UPI001664BAC1|nr:nucleotide pyrophosphohydrolase [Tersicoccus solisilvae]
MPTDRVAETLSTLRSFMEERNWPQFHTPENLAKSIAIEAGELLECFQWSAETDHDRIRHELADVMTYCFLLADNLDSDPIDLIYAKLEITSSKYPVERSRGRSAKSDQL